MKCEERRAPAPSFDPNPHAPQLAARSMAVDMRKNLEGIAPVARSVGVAGVEADVPDIARGIRQADAAPFEDVHAPGRSSRPSLDVAHLLASHGHLVPQRERQRRDGDDGADSEDADVGLVLLRADRCPGCA